MMNKDDLEEENLMHAVNSFLLQDMIDIPITPHFLNFLDLVVILVNDFLYGNLFLNTAWSSSLISNYISKIKPCRTAVHDKIG